jgi:hypothetical protein
MLAEGTLSFLCAFAFMENFIAMGDRYFLCVSCQHCIDAELIPLVELQSKEEQQKYSVPLRFDARCYQCQNKGEYAGQDVFAARIEVKPEGFQNHPAFRRLQPRSAAE